MKSISIYSPYFVSNEEFDSLTDMQFYISKEQDNLYKLTNTKIESGYLIRIHPEKYILLMGCFINHLDYDSFKKGFAFFFTTDDCIDFDTHIEDTDSGVICNNLIFYDCQQTLNVCVWDADGNFVKEQLPFITEQAKPKLVLISHQDDDGYDSHVSVGMGLIIDAKDIIGEIE